MSQHCLRLVTSLTGADPELTRGAQLGHPLGTLDKMSTNKYNVIVDSGQVDTVSELCQHQQTNITSAPGLSNEALRQ